MESPSRQPPYTDVCDKCADMPYVTPVLVTPDLRSNSGGVAADYMCPAGHTWTTGWGKRDTDDWEWAA